MSKNSLQYSPEVDGLRAYAVMVVLLFHVGFETFSGGYVGVDVFFVISGYLITRLIRHEISNDTFTFSNFYIRRVRRLLPAAFVTIFVTLIVGYFVFAPADLERLGGAAFYAILSISNFFFWIESGYFDASAGSKPLLHTWSLSVEEQFYYVWPICLLLLSKIRKRLVIPIIAVIAGIGSLVITEWMLNNDPSGAFYLLPFRVAEFAVGVVAVWAVDRRSSNPVVLETANIAGLVMITASVFLFEEATRFPGINSMLPCIGTALVIYGATAKVSGQLLSNKIAVGIGLISYSLYLVHWPVIVFYNYYNFATPSLVEKCGMIVVSFILALLMYKFVETPFRTKRGSKSGLSAPAFGLAAALASLFILFPAANVWAKKGWPWRFDISTETKDVAIEKDILKNKILVAGRKAKKEIVVLGDSIGVDMFETLYLTEAVKNAKNFRLTRRTRGGCRPVLGPSVSSPPGSTNGKKCERFFEATYDAIVKSNPAIIIMYSRWGGVPKFIPSVMQQTEQSVDHLLKNTDAKIVFIDYAPDFKKSVMEGAHLLFRLSPNKFNAKLESLRNVDAATQFDAFFKQLTANNDRLFFITLKDKLCPDEHCEVFANGNFTIMDQVHLTSWGKQRTAKILDEKLNKSPLGEILRQ